MAKGRQDALLLLPKSYDAAAEKAQNVIGKKIAQARKDQGLSLSALSQRLSACGLTIQRQGISHWETGVAVPNAYQLLAVCRALHIEDGLAFFSESEAELSELGRKKLLDYKQDLIASGRYKPQTETHNNIVYVDMRVSTLPASAGTGMLLDEENFELMRFPASTIPNGAEFGIRVRGDSMEPVYQDGQIIWIKTCKTLHPGDVGLFMYDGNGYVKVYREQVPTDDVREIYTDDSGAIHMQPVLISYNEKYEPKPVNPELGFCIVGRVLN